MMERRTLFGLQWETLTLFSVAYPSGNGARL